MKRNVNETSVALSVVVAVREAEETIGRDVRRIADHLRAAGVSFEVLAVNDGCCDNSLAILQLLAAQVPELRLCPGNACGRAFIRGAAEARGEAVALLDGAARELPLASFGWALARLGRGADAVVFRGRYVLARRLACLAAIVRSGGRGDAFQRSFERNAHRLEVEVVGSRPRRVGLLSPVLRFLAV
jgi:glycosyltransferase involved in cell wall biosynthesis